MFDLFRKHTKVLQFVLVLLIFPSFIFFGVQGYSRNEDSAVAKVAGQRVTQTEWDMAHRRYADSARAQNPQIDANMLDSDEFKRQALDAVVRNYLLAAVANDQHLRASDARVLRMFSTDPQFQFLRNPDGSLNKAVLNSQGMSAADFQERLRSELSINQVLGGVTGSATGSKVSVKQALNALFQERDVQWLALGPEAYSAKLQPTEEQLQAFFKQADVAKSFQIPERADVQYLQLDLDTVKQRVTVNEDELRKSYQENISHYTVPQERRASHILIMVAQDAPEADKKAARAKAEQVLAEVKKAPAAFADLARKYSDDTGSAAQGGDLDFFGKGAMTPPFEEAVFALQPGQVSDIVASDFGFHIIKLTGVRGGESKPFEAVRAQIEEEARAQLAQREYADAADRFSNAVFEQADSLDGVAKDFKLTVQSLNGLLRQPAPGQSQGVFDNAELRGLVFEEAGRPSPRNTAAVSVGVNSLVSARIVKYTPANMPGFDTVKDAVRARWIQVEALKAARQDAQAKLEQWRKDPGSATLPAATTVSRRRATAVPFEVLEAVMRVPAQTLPGWSLADLGPHGTAIIKVNKVQQPALPEMEVQMAEQQLSELWARAEGDAYFESLKSKNKLKFQGAGLKVQSATAAPQE